MIQIHPRSDGVLSLGVKVLVFEVPLNCISTCYIKFTNFNIKEEQAFVIEACRYHCILEESFSSSLCISKAIGWNYLYFRFFCRQRHRAKLWQDIEAVTGQFIANQIVQSLCVITLDGTERLREFTNKIDIRKDAEKLKFKYEQGHLVDVSSAPVNATQR